MLEDDLTCQSNTEYDIAYSAHCMIAFVNVTQHSDMFQRIKKNEIKTKAKQNNNRNNKNVCAYIFNAPTKVRNV